MKNHSLINSVNLEKIPGTTEDKCYLIFQLMQGTDWDVITLTCDKVHGTSQDVQAGVEITKGRVEKAKEYEITPD